MDDKEKFQLIIKFLDKLIIEKTEVNVNYNEYGNYSVNYIVRSDDEEIGNEYYGVSLYNNSLRFWNSDSFGMKMDLMEDQIVEFKYKINQLMKISEDKSIEYLKSI